MSFEARYLTAVGDYHNHLAAARENLGGEARSRAISSGVRAAGNLMQRIFYGSLLTLDYAVNARLLDFQVDDELRSAHGLQIGTAAGMLKADGEELPPSFADFISK